MRGISRLLNALAVVVKLHVDCQHGRMIAGETVAATLATGLAKTPKKTAFALSKMPTFWIRFPVAPLLFCYRKEPRDQIPVWEQVMKAIQLDGTSDDPSFSLVEVPMPQPGEGQVLIKVHAAGVIATELEWYPTSHHKNGEPRQRAIPGHEYSGTIAAVGDAVTSFAPGQEVYGMNDWFWEGATAEYCVAVPSSIALKPKSLSHVEAATVPISALTAWQGLHTRAEIKPGERVLIQGGAGAVGLFVVQLAHRRGAYVIATASRENIPLVQNLGADQVIDYKTSRFEDGLASVDVVFDTVGGNIRERSAAVLKPGGHLITIAADNEVNTDPKVRAAYFIVEPNQDQLEEVGRLLDQGQLKTFVKGVVSLQDAGLAYSGAVPKKGSTGKFVVQVVPSSPA